MSAKSETAAEVRRILRALKALPEDDAPRHQLLTRDLAEAILRFREHFLTPEGRPDWTGRTWAYRNAVRELYADAGYGPEERRTSQSTVRYHVGNLLRERLPRAELEAAGLDTPSPHERQREARARDRAIVRPGQAPAEQLTAARAVLAAVRALHASALADPELSGEGVATLAAIRDAAATLARQAQRIQRAR